MLHSVTPTRYRSCVTLVPLWVDPVIAPPPLFGIFGSIANSKFPWNSGHFLLYFPCIRSLILNSHSAHVVAHPWPVFHIAAGTCRSSVIFRHVPFSSVPTSRHGPRQVGNICFTFRSFDPILVHFCPSHSSVTLSTVFDARLHWPRVTRWT